MHTIFTGEGPAEVPEPPVKNEEPTEPQNTNSSECDAQVERTAPVAKMANHNATCDLCDSAIKGDRFVSINTAQYVSLTPAAEMF